MAPKTGRSSWPWVDLALLGGEHRRRGLQARRLTVSRVEDGLAVVKVGQARDPALHGAAPEGHHGLGLAAQEGDHFLLFGGAHRTVDKRCRQLAVGQGLHVLTLEVQGHRPEHHVNELDGRQQLIVEVDYRLFAAAAGGAPVEGHLRLGHGCLPSRRLRRARPAGVAKVLELVGPRSWESQPQRAQVAQLLGHFVAHALDLLAFGRRRSIPGAAARPRRPTGAERNAAGPPGAEPCSCPPGSGNRRGGNRR